MRKMGKIKKKQNEDDRKKKSLPAPNDFLVEGLANGSYAVLQRSALYTNIINYRINLSEYVGNRKAEVQLVFEC